MAQKIVKGDEEVVLTEEMGCIRLITLNQPRRLNVITPNLVALLANFLEKWEKDDTAALILFKGSGRAFSAGGDLKVFYDGRMSKDPCVEVVYRMYWLCYHIHTYKKTLVALVDGISMGGGASFMVPMKFSVVTEKTVFATPEASIGFHTDCGFSYMLSRLQGHLGEFLGLTGARLNGKELVEAGLATHFVPSEKLPELEKRLIALNSGEANAVKPLIDELSVSSQIDENSVLNNARLAVIDDCFSKDSVEEIILSLEVEASKEGNGWIVPFLKSLKRSSPTSLKITLQSIREGRKQSLAECLKKEFRITMNILRTMVSGDVYEGIRALTIDKDNAPKWDPSNLEAINIDKINEVFQPFSEDLELKIPNKEHCRAFRERTIHIKILNMISAQKLVRFAFRAGIAVLSLLLSIVSANELTRRENVQSNNKHKILEISPQLSFQIKLHGFLLWASVGFLMPAGILIKRMANRRESRRKLRIIFYIHVITQVVAVLLATAAAVLSLIYFENSFNNDHQRIGLAIYGVLWLQPLIGMIRPHRGSKGRSFWFIFHWLVGIAISLLGVINIYTGLQAYHKRTSKTVKFWTLIFTVEISFILFLYLLQEKWHYIQKQGAILGDEPIQPTDQEMSPRCEGKEEIR